MIPTVIRFSSRNDGQTVGMVITTLGHGKLEARFQVYEIAADGRTYLAQGSGVWDNEQGAIAAFDRWRADAPPDVPDDTYYDNDGAFEDDSKGL